MDTIETILTSLSLASSLPKVDFFLDLINRTIEVLSSESKKYRTGTMISFSDKLPTIVVPDLHARTFFLMDILNFSIDLENEKITILEALQEKKIRVVCLGDGLHAESREKERWHEALKDYCLGVNTGPAMLSEMSEGLSLMCMVMECKCNFTENFHFLKGNHENIMNSAIRGNHPFCKFAMEGDMVTDFMNEYYGSVLLERYAYFESCLPYFYKGPRFVCSHAEPKRFFSKDELTKANEYTDIADGLTWTSNDESVQGSVFSMLKALFPTVPDSVYFGGHRPIFGIKYKLRCDGKFIQIHNPDAENIAFVSAIKKFNPETDIICVEPVRSNNA